MTVKGLVLVHGAGSGPWVFDSWAESFPDLNIKAVDLQENLDVAAASMEDYAANVAMAADDLPRPLGMCGWSMGGLVAMMAASKVLPAGLVLLEASAPAESQGFSSNIAPRHGLFDPEETYGQFPEGMAARPESLFARDQRKRGISIPSLPCSTLVVSGKEEVGIFEGRSRHEYREERGSALAAAYGAQHIEFPNLDHWELVMNPEVQETIRAFLMDLPGTS